MIALLLSAMPAWAGYQRDAYVETFTTSVGGWTGNGDFFLDTFYGHLTPNGAARNMGSGQHRIQSPCIRVDGHAVDFPSHGLEISVRASVSAFALIETRFYFDPNCTDLSGPTGDSLTLAANSFHRSTAEFPIFQQERSLRLFVTVTPNEPVYFSTFVDDFRLIHYGPEELLSNVRFHDDTAAWSLTSGDSLIHDSVDGHLSPSGSARVDGHQDGFAAIATECVDLSGVPGDSFHVGASIQPPSGTPGITASGMLVGLFEDTDCTVHLDTLQVATHTDPGQWNRVEGDLQLIEGTRSLLLVVGADLLQGGATLFDDATLYSKAIFADGFEDGLGSWSAVSP